MFVESLIEDSIKIYPSTRNIEDTIYEVLNAKYRNKYTKKMGLGIFVNNKITVLERKCVEDFVLYTVQFNIFFFRFLKDEVIEGTVKSQNDTGIQVTIKFFDRIHIPLDNLPDNSEITYIYDENKSKHLAWVWNYKGNRYFVKKDEPVKFRVVDYDCENRMVVGDFSDCGLGPVSWWQ